MAKMIKLNIDLNKIDKKRVNYHKNGGKYYDIFLLETPGGKYGDWMAKEDRTKEERDKRVPDTILGNAKNIGWGSSSGPSNSGSQQSTNVSVDDLGI